MRRRADSTGLVDCEGEMRLRFFVFFLGGGVSCGIGAHTVKGLSFSRKSGQSFLSLSVD